MTAADYGALFLMGLLGTGHCLGMCAPFALAASAGANRVGAILWRQMLYQFGKALTYVFLAVLLAAVSSFLAGSGADWLVGAQNVLTVIVGVLMIGLGIGYTFEVRLAPALAKRWEGSRLCSFATGILQAQSAWRCVAIGWINGFLPCGLSFAAIGYAASFGSVVDAAGGAALFGLSTLPGLAALALLGGKLFAGNSRRWLVRAAGITLILFGLITLVRGVPSVHAWFHELTVFR